MSTFIILYTQVRVARMQTTFFGVPRTTQKVQRVSSEAKS